MSDEQKTKRRTVVANNEAWRSAEKVRRAWLTDFLTRRTPPNGSAAFVAAALAHGDHALSRAVTNGRQRARDLFRLDHLTDDADDTAARRRGKTLTGLLDGASDNRALVVALGIILAAYEDAWTTDTWRRPQPRRRPLPDVPHGQRLHPIRGRTARSRRAPPVGKRAGGR
jgi:ParB family chromosome partitioning protein